MAAWGLRANDDQLSTADLIRNFRELYASEPWDLLGIRFDTAVIRFRRDVPEPLKMARWLRKWCSDLGEPRDVARRLAETRCVHFWWD